MSANYQRFLKLLEKWPIDKTKGAGRDLGEHLRQEVKSLAKLQASSSQETESQRKQIESLERIVNNDCGNRYKRKLTSTATGLNAEQCKQVLSVDFLESLQRS